MIIIFSSEFIFGGSKTTNTYKISIDDVVLDVMCEKSNKIRHIKIILVAKNKIKLRAPKSLGEAKAKEVVNEHKKWILKNISKLKTKLDISSKIAFLGEVYDVMVDMTQDDVCKVDMQNKIYILNNNYNKKKQVQILKGFYKTKAKELCDDVIDEISKQTKLKANKITYRFATTRWGSCSHNNNISLNYMMLQFDVQFIRYVILHEFCHIKHKNHSKKFWELVQSYMGDYKMAINKCHIGEVVDIDV